MTEITDTENNNINTSYLREFYDIISMEKKIKLDFNKNLKMINNLIRNAESPDLEVNFFSLNFLKNRQQKNLLIFSNSLIMI